MLSLNLLGDNDRTEKQASAFREFSVLGFHLLGDIDRIEKQVSVLREF